MEGENQKFDWRDMATQVPGDMEAGEQGLGGGKNKTPWSRTRGKIILASAAIAILMIVWASNCHSWDALLPALILIIDVLGTMVILAIGSVINSAVKNDNGDNVDTQYEKEYVSDGEGVRDATVITVKSPVVLLSLSIIEVLLFPFAFIWGEAWRTMGAGYTIVTTLLGVLLIIQAIASLQTRSEAARKTLTSAMPGALIAVCLNFAFLVPLRHIYMEVFIVYVLFAIIPLAYRQYKTNDALVSINAKAVALASIIIPIIALCVYYFSPMQSYLQYVF